MRQVEFFAGFWRRMAIVVLAGGTTRDFTPGPALIPRFPDLVALDVVSPATGVGGRTIDVTWRTANQGDALAGAPWTETRLPDVAQG